MSPVPAEASSQTCPTYELQTATFGGSIMAWNLRAVLNFVLTSNSGHDTNAVS